MNIQEAKQIKIADYLQSLGYSPVKQQGNCLWYKSPFRQETEASFKVNTDRNLWFDYGLGRGGNIIALAGVLYASDHVPYLLGKIAEQAPHIRPISFSFRQQASEPSFQHLEVGELTHPAGGFEVRNRFFKGCVAPKDISHIRQQGEAREKCLVFEGMMDYLSFLTLRKRNCSNLPDLDRQDYVILNSTANVSKAIDVLHGYGRIHCMLDNDEAGRKAYRELERKFAGRIRDFSDNYKGHKDLNDYLRGIRQKLAVSPPLRTIVKPKKKGLGL